MRERLIIKNGTCITMDEKKNADWIVIEEENIIAVGDGLKYQSFINDNTTMIDAKGNSVLPGFIDSHFHVVKTAVSERCLDLTTARCYEDIGNLIERHLVNNPNENIIAKGLAAEKLKEGLYPDRTVLDKFCPNVAIVIYSVDLHILMLNTYGILFYKVPFTLNGVVLDNKGMPTGIFRQQAGAKLDVNIMTSFSSNVLDETVMKLIPQLIERGITTVAAMEGGNIKTHFDEDYECEFIYRYGEKYPITMELYYQTTDVNRVSNMRLPRMGGALYVDGTIGTRTAALSFPYADEPGKRGILCFEQSNMERLVLDCCERNIQLALDAIGDVAIESALVALENAAKKYNVRAMRHRIEHAELITEDQMERASELGVVLSMQPTYEGLWGNPNGMYKDRLGERYGTTNCLREILDSDIVICGGSDCPVTDYNPMIGIHYAVNHPIKKHRVTLSEALKMYTINGAYGMFIESEVGSITPSKKADIIILDRNIEETQESKLKDVKVDISIKAGEIIFHRGAEC